MSAAPALQRKCLYNSAVRRGCPVGTCAGIRVLCCVMRASLEVRIWLSFCAESPMYATVEPLTVCTVAHHH